MNIYSDENNNEENDVKTNDKKNYSNIILIIVILVLVIVVGYYLISTMGSGNKNTSVKDKPVLVLDSLTRNLQVNSTYQINPVVNGVSKGSNGVFTYTSSDSKIVSVSNTGMITGNSVGKAEISINYVNNNVKANEVKLSVIVYEGNENISLTDASFTEGDVLMGVNDTFDLSSKVNYIPVDGKIESRKFTSSNPAVASVDDNGKVTALSLGNTTISLLINDKYNSAINVFVKENVSNGEVIVTPTNLSFTDGAQLKIKVSDKRKLNLNATPSNASLKYVTWTSSDTSIVTVDDDGNIEALKSGIGIITASSLNNVTSKITIEVEESVVPVTAITFTSSIIEVGVGESAGLIPTITPSNASNKSLFYTSSNTSVAEVSPSSDGTSATIRGNKKGNATITVKSDTGVTASISVKVTGSTYSNTPSNSGTPTLSCGSANVGSSGTCKVSVSGIEGVSATNPGTATVSGWNSTTINISCKKAGTINVKVEHKNSTKVLTADFTCKGDGTTTQETPLSKFAGKVTCKSGMVWRSGLTVSDVASCTGCQITNGAAKINKPDPSPPTIPVQVWATDNNGVHAIAMCGVKSS